MTTPWEVKPLEFHSPRRAQLIDGCDYIKSWRAVRRTKARLRRAAELRLPRGDARPGVVWMCAVLATIIGVGWYLWG